jgi:hypothetical protein
MERVRMKRRTVEPTPRLALFGPPPLIEDEDAATYDELFARFRAAVQPVDVIMIRARARKALEAFLCEQLDYDLYSDLFADRLTEILQENLSDDQAKGAQKLAHQCARNEPDAVDKVNNILEGFNPNLNSILDDARAQKAKDLVLRYVRHESDAVTLVDEQVADAGTSVDILVAEALAANLDDIERIDHLTTIAEGRRNASLREIDRHHVVLGETLRRSVQEVEARERKLLEPPAKGEKAA